jgi:tripartite-type tricarboxylate transporter receptor subunit TctC
MDIGYAQYLFDNCCTPLYYFMHKKIFDGDTMRFTKAIAAKYLLGAMVSLMASAYAQTNFPAKPVTIVLSNAAGSQADLLARQLGLALSNQWSQPVLMEYKPGASGMISGEFVARAAPDGHTLLLGSSGVMAITPNLYSKMPFDARKDFVPVGEVGSADTILVIPYTTGSMKLQSLIGKAKATKTPLSFGSLGSGSTSNIASQMFGKVAGVEVMQVPYKSESQLITDLVAGRLDFSILPMASTMSFIKSSKLSPVAIASKQRSKFLPDVPSTAELGIPGVEMVQWFGLFAPARTPAPILAKLAASVRTALNNKDTQTSISNLGIDPGTRSAPEFLKFFNSQYADYGQKIKEMQIKVE